MKHLFILNDPPYGTERSYNALVKGTRRGSLEELADWSLWADRTLVF